MSRSRKKTKIFGITTAVTEKLEKSKANRRLRRKVKSGDMDATLRDVSDPWSMQKDGKHYHSEATKKEMRK